jgi:hypothetical protein
MFNGVRVAITHGLHDDFIDVILELLLMWLLVFFLLDVVCSLLLFYR